MVVEPEYEPEYATPPEYETPEYETEYETPFLLSLKPR